MSEIGIDDPAFYAGDPDPVLAALRRDRPVSWHDDFWLVTRHEDVASVSSRPDLFCSGGGVLPSDRRRTVSASDSILYLDPPLHARDRRLISRAFTPRTVTVIEPRLHTLAANLLDTIDPAAIIDAVDAISAPFPLLVIAELLGIPSSDHADFRRWSDAVMAAATDLNDDNATLAAELLVYFDDQLRRRAASPTDDLLSALVAAEVDGERLRADEQLGFCMTLLVAGNETTRSLITGGIATLARHPDQRDRLAVDPSAIPAAVEEMLRWVTPIMAMARTATVATTVGTCPVAAGDYVVMSYGAANRDEAVFGPDADRFDATRSPNPHLAFGFGEHFCIGAGLARLEARVLFEELLRRWPRFALAGEPVTIPSTVLRQYAHLPVRLGG
ncbi:MAG: cytochrome P450 [Acidimicrobiales bacterium]